MKIVILAFASDTHTAALKWALERAGYSVVCWAGLSWMEDRQATLSIEQGTRVVLGRHVIEPGDVVWIRRPNPPMHNSDVPRPIEILRRLSTSGIPALFCICWSIFRYAASTLTQLLASSITKPSSFILHRSADSIHRLAC